MRVCDIREHFLANAAWVDRTTTVDRVIIGDPDKNVDACAVTWMPSLSACRQVVRRGFELLICHEPTFWHHRDDQPGQMPGALAKMRFLEDSGLTILRNHDCWDRWPGVGITAAWARFLGLGGPVAATGAANGQHRYDIDPVEFDRFAADVAARTARIGEPLIEVAGEPTRRVSRIGIGTGCITKVATFLEMGCDCCILCDDGTSYWRDVQHARDLDIPVICVNHGTSEEPGMVSMTHYINENLQGVTAEHFSQGCRFRRVGAAAEGSTSV